MPPSVTVPPGAAGAAEPHFEHDPLLEPGTRLGTFEIEQVEARGDNSVVYLATDHALDVPVAIQEYFPRGLVTRDAWRRMKAREPSTEHLVAQGLVSFIDEARMFARCDHPALVRVLHMFEVYGTAYRVMPYYSGMSLLDRRRGWEAPPDEDWLRDWLQPMLGALETLHRLGRIHGGVDPQRILLLEGDRPVLLAPGAARHQLGSTLVDQLMASLESSVPPQASSQVAEPTRVADDLCALAEVARFCITGEWPPRGDLQGRHEPIAASIERVFAPAARPVYGPELLSALDAAMSVQLAERPLSVSQLRESLVQGSARRRPAPSRPAMAEVPDPRADLTVAYAPRAATAQPAVRAVPPAARATPASVPPGPDAPPLPSLPQARINAAREQRAAAARQNANPRNAAQPSVYSLPEWSETRAIEPFDTQMPASAALSAAASAARAGAPTLRSVPVAAPGRRQEPRGPTAPATEPPVLTSAIDGLNASKGEFDDPLPSLWPGLANLTEGSNPEEFGTGNSAAAPLSADVPMWASSAMNHQAWEPPPPLRAAPRYRRTAAALAVLLAVLAGAGWAYWDKARSVQASRLAVGSSGLADDSLSDGSPRAGAPADVDDTAPPPAGASTLPSPLLDSAPPKPVAPRAAPPAPLGAVTAAPSTGSTRTWAGGGGGANTTVAATGGVAGLTATPLHAFDSPRAACAPRTDFSLFRCVQVLCGNARWAKHPQCVHLKESGDVD